MHNSFLRHPLLLSPDTATSGLGSASATSGGVGGSEGSGSAAPKAQTAGSPSEKAVSDAPPASKTSSEPAPGKNNDVSSAPPRKSISQKLAEIHEKIREREKEHAVKEAKEAGKKEAIEEVKKEAKQESEKTAEKEEKKKEEKKKYEPNYKYKLKDKELEFDEFIRPSITDEETEKKVRDLYSRASGLEYHQTKTKEIEQQMAQQSQSFSQVMSKLQEANEAFARDDLDAVFQTMNIPQEKVLQWLAKKAQYAEMDPDQRQVHDERQRAVQEARQASRQAQDLRTQQIQNASAGKLREFELVTKIPTYEEYAKSFDASRKEGAFRSAVADRGELAYMRGKDISVEEAVKEVIELYGPAPTKTLNTSAESKGASNNGSSKESRNEPPTIPNVSGRAESAVSQTPKYRSTKDLRKRLSELSAQERA